MEFERQQYMVGPERLYLAHTLQLTEAQVSPVFRQSFATNIILFNVSHQIDSGFSLLTERPILYGTEHNEFEYNEHCVNFLFVAL